MAPTRVAVVGGGIAGIACLWTLRESGFEVDLYEAEPSLGGHAHTAMFERNGHKTPVDMGFVAYNEETYR